MNQGLLAKLVLGMAVVTGCNDASVIGEDFIEGSDFELSLDNSLPLEMSTLRFDSLITSQSDRLLVGGTADAEFGGVSIESYFLLNLRDGQPSQDPDELRYDSTTLYLPMDGYSVYLDEVTQSTDLVVEQLAAELEYVEDENALYNYSEIDGATNVRGTPLGEGSFLLSTDRVRDLEMRLSDTWGRDLFSRMQNDDDIFSDAEEAAAYLRGFRLYIRDPSFVFGISKDSVKVIVHATNLGSSSRTAVDFEFSISTRPHYSRFEHTDIPTNLEVVDVEDEIPSRLLDDRAFIIGGLGYATKVNLTPVRDLLLDGDDFILVSAELRLRWFDHETNMNPQRLTAQFVNEDFVDLADGQQFSLLQSFDDEYGRDNFYTMDATIIADFILEQPVGAEYYLLLTLDDFQSSLTSVILGDKTFTSTIDIYTIKN